MRLGTRSLGLCVVILLSSAAWAADKAPTPAETPAEKLRKALDRVRDLEIIEQPLDAAVNQLREQTGINFLIDRIAVAPAPVLGAAAGTGINPMVPAPFAHLRVHGRFHKLPVRAAVTKMLRDHGLTHVLLSDTVLITAADKAIERQLGQIVSVNIEDAALSGALKQLARETGANLVLDPRSAKEGRSMLTVRLDEVPLETAVELLADEAGLRAVRLNNVLYVTSEARAEKLQKSRPAPAPARREGWQVWPDGNGGFRMLPPAGATIGGGGGIGGLGGIGGIAGLGGGGFNQLGAQGGMAGRPVGPVPLTPPLPKKDKQAVPEKPKTETPPAAPGEKDKPASKDKPQAQAIRPSIRSPQSRRKAPTIRTS